MSAGPSITGVGVAVPGSALQQDLWDQYFANHFADLPAARRIFRTSGVQRRHAVVDPRFEDVSQWPTSQRMQRFLLDSLPLGAEAIGAALKDAGLVAADLGLFAVASCTGYVTPGVDILLARELGMSDTVQRLSIGHMGCYAAVPGLAAVGDFTGYRGRPSLLLNVELTSLHLQPPTTNVDQVVAHALFSDAATAIVVENTTVGLRIIETIALTDSAHADLMTWDVTDLGFRMGLSPEVPNVLSEHVLTAMSELLHRQGLGVADISRWFVHPGGPRILDVVEQQLGLPDGALGASRHVLQEHGNCSSATAPMVLDYSQRTNPTSPGDFAVMMAFGPGLTLYATLLHHHPSSS